MDTVEFNSLIGKTIRLITEQEEVKMNFFDFMFPLSSVLSVLLSIFVFYQTKIQNQPVQGESSEEQNKKVKLIRISKVILIFSLISTLVCAGEKIREMLYIENAILPENSNWYENERFYIKTGSPFIKAYFTTETSDIEHNGIPCEGEYTLDDPIFKVKDGKITIFYQLTFLGFNCNFFSSDTSEKIYKVDQNTSFGDSDKFTSISAQIVDDFPCISSSEVNSGQSELCIYKCLSINGDLINKEDKMNAIVTSGNLSPITFPYVNNTIAFSDSNRRRFRKIYIMGGKNIDRLIISTKSKDYICEFPEIFDSCTTVVELDLKRDILEDEIYINIFSNDGCPEITSLWFDKYIVE